MAEFSDSDDGCHKQQQDLMDNGSNTADQDYFQQRPVSSYSRCDYVHLVLDENALDDETSDSEADPLDEQEEEDSTP